jgi:hypothetical protein
VLKPTFFFFRTQLNLIDEFRIGECTLALIDFLLFATQRLWGGDHKKLLELQIFNRDGQGILNYAGQHLINIINNHY